ncbi:MAG: hypothetical protein K5678_03260 [Acetatifactor sp.]|nr:hypothetical protein [Acetatifactor sp.]
MDDFIYVILFALLVVALIVAAIVSSKKTKKLMEAQRANNTDKRDMLDLMSKVTQEAYGNYTYVVGYYTKVKQQSLNTTAYYYFPYIVAFNAEDMIIFPFIKKEGRLYIRNELKVDWNQTQLKVKQKKNGVLLTLKIMGETMPINIDAVIKSQRVEKSDRPLAVFQEAEYEKLKALLPQFVAKSKRA